MAIPRHYTPMLATIRKDPFDDPDWQYEVKWDGYRMFSYIEKGKVNLKSRNNVDYSLRFSIVADDLSKWKHDGILDGEMVVVRENGISHFNALENWNRPTDGQLRYYVFDLLWLDGKSLLELPLVKRRQLLKKNFPKSKLICFNEAFGGEQGTALFEQAQHHGLEGIIAKKKDSEYFPGARTENWLKIKVQQWVKGVIVGYTKEHAASHSFRRLLIAVRGENKTLEFIGSVGTGFSQQSISQLLRLLKEVRKCPLPYTPDVNKASRFKKASTDIVVWVKPELVANIKYQEITSEGVMRHASFKGLVK